MAVKNNSILMLVVGVAVVILFIGQYNKPVQMEEAVRKAWGDVETVLQRRFDLIPNLVATVKGYAKHEEGIFLEIARSREAWFNAKTPGERINAAQGLEGAISRLLMITENYPNLKASESFNRLMDELSGTENRINVANRRFNEAVQKFRAYGRAFPGSIFIGMHGIDLDQYDYFQSKEGADDAPVVDF